LKPDAGVITTLPSPGTQLGEGDVALAASGRPVFVLQGEIPAYRDLGPGLVGDDVRQFEEALLRMGFDPGPVDGTYDEGTGAAVAAWYLSAGWQPFEATADQLAEIRAHGQELTAVNNDKLSADDAVSSALADLDAARAAHASAIAAAAAAPGAVAVARADAHAANQAAAADVAAKTAVRDQVVADPSPTPADRANAEADLAAAQAAAVATRLAGEVAIQAAVDDDAAATRAVAVARADASAGNQAAAADVGAKTAVWDAVVADPSSTPADRANAEADLAAAQAAAVATQLAGEVAIRAAVDDAAAATSAVAVARAEADAANQAAAADVAAKTAVRDQVVAGTSSTPADRANAEADLAAAQAAAVATRLAGEVAIQAAVDAQSAAEREVGIAAASVDSAEQAVLSAQTQRSNLDDSAGRIAADLATARRRAGVQVPVDEIVFVSAVPVRVEQIDVASGDAASGPVMTVTNSQLAIDSSLPLDEAPLVEPGMAVTIDEPDLGITATGVVGRVADAPGTDGVDGFHIYLEVLVDDTTASLVGVSVRLTIPIESTGGAVLAVPVSALSLAVDGTSRVQVDNNGSLEFIVVEPGLSAAGFVQVTPVDGTLTPGQLVVIGFQQGTGAPGG